VIVVDQIVTYPAAMTTDKGLPGRDWCHLMSSLDGPAGERELIAFGDEIGLMRSWLQYKTRVHYDLTPKLRTRALQGGAISVDTAAFARARMAGPESLAAYLAPLMPVHERPVFGVTKAPNVNTRPTRGKGRA
jgi:uncharacterized protein DUF4031